MALARGEKVAEVCRKLGVTEVEEVEIVQEKVAKEMININKQLKTNKSQIKTRLIEV